MSQKNQISRREFLRIAGMTGAGATLAACLPAAPPSGPSSTGPTTAASRLPAGGPLGPRGMGVWGGGTLIDPPKRYDGLTITQGFQVFPTVSPVDTDTDQDNIMLRWIQEQTGVWYERVGGSGDVATQRWATAMASGDLPEVMNWVTGDRVEQLFQANQFQDITEIWERTASPLVKQLKQYPDHFTWRTTIRDGRVYGVPWCEDSVGAQDSIMYIRKDWLDQVGLQPPSTLDDYKEVARAFQVEGLAEIGFLLNSNLVSWIASADPIFGAFGVMPTYWLQDGQGGLIYGSIAPENVGALEVLRDWYTDGIISQEFVTMDFPQPEIMSGKAGIFSLPYWGYDWCSDLFRNDPNAELIHVDGPAGPDGRRGRKAQKLGGAMVGFRAGIEEIKVEAVINHLNWVMERWQNCVENADYLFVGCTHDPIVFEGYDFVWEGNEIKDGPTTTLHWGSVSDHPMEFHPTVTTDAFNRMDKILAKDEADRNPFEKFIVSNPLVVGNREAHRRLVETKEWQIHDQADGMPPTSTMLERWADLQKLEQEWYIQFIIGEQSLSAFDQFVAAWKQQGGDQITQEVNEWYSTVSST